MDRNTCHSQWIRACRVALRKESVDRNPGGLCYHSVNVASLSARRAWIEIQIRTTPRSCRWSLSARRAWIEIPAGCWRDSRRAVALRKESVDRNFIELSPWGAGGASLSARRAWIEIVYPGTWSGSILSLSARRAWIEILSAQGHKNQTFVALRKESVDRNSLCFSIFNLLDCRSPQGERG